MRDCKNRQLNNRRVYTIEEATTVNDVARSSHKFIQPLIIDKLITKLQWWRWKV
jgi:hypothetical protein